MQGTPWEPAITSSFRQLPPALRPVNGRPGVDAPTTKCYKETFQDRGYSEVLPRSLRSVLAFPLGCVCILVLGTLALGVCCVVWGQPAGGEGAATIGTSHLNHSQLRCGLTEMGPGTSATSSPPQRG